MAPSESARDTKLEEIFAAFNKSWMKYWDSYVGLQDALYESLRAAREVSWLAGTDAKKLSEINQVQRELFSNMPRRLDYVPLGQIMQDMDGAPTKISDLEAALASEQENLKRLEEAIAVLKEKTELMKAALKAAGP